MLILCAVFVPISVHLFVPVITPLPISIVPVKLPPPPYLISHLLDQTQELLEDVLVIVRP